jgi:hypothetical protein
MLRQRTSMGRRHFGRVLFEGKIHHRIANMSTEQGYSAIAAVLAAMLYTLDATSGHLGSDTSELFAFVDS